MGRYREFDITLNDVQKPADCGVFWKTGCDMAKSFNDLCRMFLEHKRFEWLWILGDDHVFHPELLIRLLGRNVDIVSPLCLKRTSPFRPVVYTEREGKYWQISSDRLDGKTGLLRVAACGNAGMLIRRRVIEKIGDDWHRVGWQTPESGGSDLYFCKRATENGFDIHVDLDNHLGHIAHMAVWPVINEQGEYSAATREALDLPAPNKSKTWYQ